MTPTDTINSICAHGIALVDAATPGPWRAIHGDSYCSYPTVLRDKGPHFILFDTSDEEKETAAEDTRFPGMDADATFVAESRTLLPAALAALQEAVAALDQAIKVLHALGNPGTARQLEQWQSRIAASLTDAQKK